VKKTHAMERIIKVLNNLDKTFLLFLEQILQKRRDSRAFSRKRREK